MPSRRRFLTSYEQASYDSHTAVSMYSYETSDLDMCFTGRGLAHNFGRIWLGSIRLD